MAEKPTVLKKIKAVKRRGVESLFQRIGVSDGTLDVEYEEMKKRHDRTVRELQEMTQGMAAYLERQRDFFNAGHELADVTYEFYFGRLMGDWPPETPSALRSHQAAAAFKAAWGQCNDAVRRSVAKAWMDQSLGPLRAHVAAVVPEVQREHEQREAYVKDFDSYRRRYHALQDRHVKAASADPASAKAAELERAMYGIQSKLTAAEDRYRRQNAKVKELMLSAKVARDELLETAVLTMLTLQMELFKQAGERLADLAQFLPEDRAAPLREAVRALVAKGGPEVRVQELSGVEKMLKTVTTLGALGTSPRGGVSGGGAGGQGQQSGAAPAASGTPQQHALLPPSSASGAEGAAAPAKSPTKPASMGSAGSGGLFSSFFSRQASSEKAAATPGSGGSGGGNGNGEAPSGYQRMGSEGGDQTGALAGRAVGAGPVLARALYDNEAEDEAELAFAVGDVLEILQQDESGWWEAKLNGKVGSIPANYVEVLKS